MIHWIVRKIRILACKLLNIHVMYDVVRVSLNEQLGVNEKSKSEIEKLRLRY